MSRFLGLGAVAATGHSNRATSLRFQRCLQVLDHLLKLLVREVLEQMLCSTLCSRRTSSARPFEVARWLLPCDLFNRLLAVLAEMQQQRLDELLI